MKNLRPFIFILAAIVCLLWLFGCTYSQTYMPDLNDKAKSISDSINSKYHFEAINLTGKKHQAQAVTMLHLPSSL